MGGEYSPRRTGWTTVNLRNIAYGYGAFAAVGDGGTILVSYDGRDWAPHTSGISFDLLAVASGKGTFIAGGQAGILLQSDHLKYFLPLLLRTAE
jgi:hypothetical protein